MSDKSAPGERDMEMCCTSRPCLGVLSRITPAVVDVVDVDVDDDDVVVVGAGCGRLFVFSPATIANLWDVTDGDIDRFSESLLKVWLRGGGPTLPHLLVEARRSCVFRQLIGLAPVYYGLPQRPPLVTEREATILSPAAFSSTTSVLSRSTSSRPVSRSRSYTPASAAGASAASASNKKTTKKKSTSVDRSVSTQTSFRTRASKAKPTTATAAAPPPVRRSLRTRRS
jgi:hypothetical protein